MTLLIILILLFIVLGYYGYKRYNKEKYMNLDNSQNNYHPADPNEYDSYGLRGDLLYRKNLVNKCDLKHSILNDADGIMWQSNNCPYSEGIENVVQVKCPNTNNGVFDENDVCWKFK